MTDDMYQLLYRLDYLVRYSNIPRERDETVASHSFFVALIVLILYDEYNFDLGRALKMAICHDVPEVITNDLSHETKERFPEIKIILDLAEREIANEMPAAIREGILDYLDGDYIEHDVVKLADNMQCYQYALNEIKLGNRGYMQTVLASSQLRITRLRTRLEDHRR